MTNKQVVIATFNAHKFDEIAAILRADLPASILSLRDFPEIPEAPETGNNFAAISREKAVYYHGRTGLPVIAEDSGLVVPALKGFPGIFSARIGHDDASRIRAVLDKIKDLPGDFPSGVPAYYVCSMTMCDDSGVQTVEGRCDGFLIGDPRGSNGFGYDPIFVPEMESRTFAEMTAQEKAALSHRGRAVHKMKPLLIELLSKP